MLPRAAREEQEEQAAPRAEPAEDAGANGTSCFARFTRHGSLTLNLRAMGCSFSNPWQVFNHSHTEPCQRCCRLLTHTLIPWSSSHFAEAGGQAGSRGCHPSAGQSTLSRLGDSEEWQE